MSQSVKRLSQEVCNKSPSRFGNRFCHGCLTRCIRGGRLVNRVQRLEELDERRGFGGTQILAVCGHVAPALEDLADQLIFREACCDEVQSGATLTANARNRVAITTLL